MNLDPVGLKGILVRKGFPTRMVSPTIPTRVTSGAIFALVPNLEMCSEVEFEIKIRPADVTHVGFGPVAMVTEDVAFEAAGLKEGGVTLVTFFSLVTSVVARVSEIEEGN